MLRLCCTHISQVKMLRQQVLPPRSLTSPSSPSILQHSRCQLHTRPHIHARAGCRGGCSILRRVGSPLHHVASTGSSSLPHIPLRPVCRSVAPTSDSDAHQALPAAYRYERSPTYDDILIPPLEGNLWGVFASDALPAWCCNVLL